LSKVREKKLWKKRRRNENGTMTRNEDRIIWNQH
jgi:hypothetical protein